MSPTPRRGVVIAGLPAGGVGVAGRGGACAHAGARARLGGRHRKKIAPSRGRDCSRTQTVAEAVSRVPGRLATPIYYRA